MYRLIAILCLLAAMFVHPASAQVIEDVTGLPDDELPPAMPVYKEVQKAMTKEEAKRVLKTKAGLSDATITYLDSYRWGDDLIVKLAQAMQ